MKSYSPKLKKRLERNSAFWAAAAASGVLYASAFAGFDFWPLAFFALVPLGWAVQKAQDLSYRTALLLGCITGFVSQAIGYYWLVGMLKNFSGFPVMICVLLASLFYVAHGLFFGLLAVYWRWSLRHRWMSATALPAAWVVLESSFPFLFDNFYANALHNQTSLIQVADIGGPWLVSGLLAACSGALIDGVCFKRWRPLLTVLSLWLGVIAYGHHTVSTVEARYKRSASINVGVVQVNMGMFEKHADPREGLHRHLTDSIKLSQGAPKPDLLIWPESAFNFMIPETLHDLSKSPLGTLDAAVLFGGLAERTVDGDLQHFNTAFLLNHEHNIVGTYDKTYLLAFGEYLPLGDKFPWIYQISPRTGHFTQGTHLRPLVYQHDNVSVRLGTLICYEDVLPSFVRKMVRASHPQVLVNITNDAWFGDTIEPWTHLALAKFRAVEHHLPLVRSTNSGVSAAIDPLGRVMQHTGVYRREAFAETIAYESAPVLTLYARVGNLTWFVGLLTMLTLYRRSRVVSARK